MIHRKPENRERIEIILAVCQQVLWADGECVRLMLLLCNKINLTLSTAVVSLDVTNV